MRKNRIILIIATFMLAAASSVYAQTNPVKEMKTTSENNIGGEDARPLEGNGKDMSPKSTSASGLNEMLVRISEIEVYPEYLDEYLEFALTVGATSVREEPGVIAIYPMIQQRDACQIRILEIYANQEAYRSHIATRHFQTYKQGTLHMVKRLDLVDMTPMNPAAMPEIFRKLAPEFNMNEPIR